MRVLQIIAIFSLTLVSAAILAHTPLKSSVPIHNATLKTAPKTLILNFREAVTLAKVELNITEGEKIPLNFHATTEKSAEHSLALPNLSTGHYQVTWVAIGADTHKIDGTIAFSIQPDATVQPEATQSTTSQSTTSQSTTTQSNTNAKENPVTDEATHEHHH